MPDPLSVRCRACLAEPGDPCIGTTSDLPRERPHLLRALAGTPRLVRCEPCAGTGWEPTGRDLCPGQTGCPVCGAVPGAMCSEAGKVRGAGHRVRVRAAKAGLRPCGACDAVGWLPEPAPEGRTQDVPDELREDLRRDFHARTCTGKYTAPCGCEDLVDVAMTLLTGWAPVIERRALRDAAEALLAEGFHDDRCSYGPPGTCDCSLGEHYRWLMTRSEEHR